MAKVFLRTSLLRAEEKDTNRHGTLSLLTVSGNRSRRESESRLSIVPQGHEENKYVVKAEKKFRLACIFNGEDLDSLHQLAWLNEHGEQVDGESSARYS
jgi:hypothetical protein